MSIAIHLLVGLVTFAAGSIVGYGLGSLRGYSRGFSDGVLLGPPRAKL